MNLQIEHIIITIIIIIIIIIIIKIIINILIIGEGIVCDFSTGDGTGGSEEYLGPADTQEKCVEMVKDQRPEANGVTYGGGHGKNCYAETGMTDINVEETNWKSCQFKARNIHLLSIYIYIYICFQIVK